MAELNSYGSVMSYAIALETSLRDYYTAAGVTDRAADADKRRATLERVRRENVVEITLEPIDGLSETDFSLNLDDTSAAAQAANEATATRFYRAAAPKINVRAAARALERCGDQHAALV